MPPSPSTIVVAGLLATLAMDLVRHALTLARVPAGPVSAAVIGRWFGHGLRGRFRHASIADAAVLPHEASLGTLVHYGIGVGLALLYALVLTHTRLEHGLPLALAFGLATNVLPWLWLFPCCGFGLMGLGAPGLWRSSLINHLVYGLALYPTFAGAVPP